VGWLLFVEHRGVEICRAGGGVIDPGEPPADRAGADAGGWGVVAGVTAGAGRIVEQLKGRAAPERFLRRD
jgi:hypothetical protein